MTKIERFFRTVRATAKLSLQFAKATYRVLNDAQLERGDIITTDSLIEVFPAFELYYAEFE